MKSPGEMFVPYLGILTKTLLKRGELSLRAFNEVLQLMGEGGVIPRRSELRMLHRLEILRLPGFNSRLPVGLWRMAYSVWFLRSNYMP